jgi:hypothetical protein
MTIFLFFLFAALYAGFAFAEQTLLAGVSLTACIVCGIGLLYRFGYLP